MARYIVERNSTDETPAKSDGSTKPNGKRYSTRTIKRALIVAKGNLNAAATLSGIDRDTFYRRFKKYPELATFRDSLTEQRIDICFDASENIYEAALKSAQVKAKAGNFNFTPIEAKAVEIFATRSTRGRKFLPTRTEMVGRDGGPIVTETTLVTTPQMIAKIVSEETASKISVAEPANETKAA